MRCFGSSILFLTVLYSFGVILPAHNEGFHRLADFKDGIRHVPSYWDSQDGIAVLMGFPLVLIHTFFLGRPTILLALLSIGFLLRLFVKRKTILLSEKIFWLTSLSICWIIFYANSEILQMYAAWLFD